MAVWLLGWLTPVILWTVAIKLWAVYTEHLKDPNSHLPLPPGGAGIPFIGETIELLHKVNQS